MWSHSEFLFVNSEMMIQDMIPCICNLSFGFTFTMLMKVKSKRLLAPNMTTPRTSRGVGESD
ncbi:hypothetical protein ACNO7L_07965 [Bisgaard Taxon 45]|uniref:Uncharacterized protein n=1 Tax=Bisgaard Taxon 45 TaxID=304289 RepID=A0ABT9KD76_9PAST|nr:hypothetical protein [Bisgaard Taxon 45]